MVAKSKGDVEEGQYISLHHSRFDTVIRHLEAQAILAGQCSPKGESNEFAKGSDGWLETCLTLKGRALDQYFWPWLVCSINCIYWVCLTNIGSSNDELISRTASDHFRSAVALGITSTLSFTLVFRLNRSIIRFWDGAQAWGSIVVSCRSLAMATLIHGRDRPPNRDQMILWLATLVISTKKCLRQFSVTYEDVEGILTPEQFASLASVEDPTLYAANQFRNHLKILLDVTKDDGPLCPARSSEMRMHEAHLDSIIANIGRSFNILETPLPLVYVTHLRTFLMIYLLGLPYLTEPIWGWSTIPIVLVTSFVMLGIEGASAEVESPYDKGRVNDLDLDRYCKTIMCDLRQLVKKQNMREGMAV